MPSVEVNGININYQIEGSDSAPVLMLSNSLGTNLHMWDKQAPSFAKKFRLVRYDTRGHGKSSAPDYPYTVDMLGNDALALMDALKLDRVNLCGLSMGGMTGMWLARHAPDRITKLVLSNTAAKFGTPEAWNDRIAAVRANGMKKFAEGGVTRWFTPKFMEEHPEEVEPLRTELGNCDPNGYVANCAAIRDVDQRWTIADIKAPTLVIGGKQDPATPLANAELLASRIKGAKLVALDASHISNVECADEFTRAIEDFLTKG